MGESRATPPSFRHIPALDGIRGIAIGLVLCFHLLWSNSVTGSRAFDLIVKIRGSGWIGVDLFFALSGFLITGILLDTRENPRFFRNFYARRALRIAPLYSLVLLLLVVGFHPSSWTQARPFALLFTYLQNTPLWWNHPVSGTVANYTTHLWSLAAEEQFYLVWPLVVFLLPNRRGLLWICAAGMALAPLSRYLLLSHGDPFQATYKLTVCRADSLLGGAWLAIAHRGPMQPVIRRAAPYTFAFGVLLCLAVGWSTGNFAFESNRTVNLIGYSLLALVSASLIAMAISPSSRAVRVLGSPLLRSLGRYSYGIYVLHQMVATALEDRFGGSLRSSIPSKALLHLVLLALVLAFTIPLAMLSYHFLERPFLRLKRFFDAVPERQDLAASPNLPTPALPSAVRPQP